MTRAALGLALALCAAPAFAQVTPQKFGARGDGVTDDSAAFAAALRAGPVRVPPGRYLVGDIPVPDGGVLEGTAGMAYVGQTADTPGVTPALVARPGAKAILDVKGRRAPVIGGLVLDGARTGADCISGGSAWMVLTRVTALRCDHGLGTKNAAPGRYTQVATIIASEFADSRVGVADLVDSAIIGGAISYDSVGLFLGPGANSNNFVGLRTEWCRRYNIFIDHAEDLQFQGGLSDRAGLAGAFLSGAKRVQFTGVIFRRNGALANGDPLGDSQVVLVDGNDSVLFTAPVFEAGADDEGRPPVAPRWGITFAGRNGLVMLTGGDVRGAVRGFARGPRPDRLRLRDLEGAHQD